MSPLDNAVPKSLSQLLGERNFLHIPSTGWTSTLVGTGTQSQGITAQRINSGLTASSSSLLTVLLWNNFGLLGVAGVPGAQTINWAKGLDVTFIITRTTGDAEGVAYIQIKKESGIGALADKGIGLRIDNFALVGVSYGTSGADVDLATTLSSADNVKIRIVFDAVAGTITWYVDNVSKGTQSTAAKLPVTTSNVVYAAISVANGVTGGTNFFLDVSNLSISQLV